MKKITALSFAIIGTIVLFSTSSCKKVWDEIKQHPNGAADNCRITQIADTWFTEDEQVYDTARFVYNNHGDPVRVIRTSNLSYYLADQAFVYDNQHRLIAFVDDIPGHDINVGTRWHTYTYIGNAKILDTTFIYSSGDYTVNYRPTAYSYIRVSMLMLDNMGRVIKETNNDGDFIFTYDGSGNLIKPGVTYTNKKNIRQTNKTWMLIDRNYSINQPNGDAVQYNSNKLPVKFNDNYRVQLGQFDYFRGIVTYDCK